MEQDQLEPPSRSLTRLGGALYLIIILGGLFGEALIRNRMIVPADASATAANIKSMESLWRIGIAGEFFMLMCTTCLALIFYKLLRPVSKDLAMLVVFFNLISVAIEAVNEQHLLAALFPLANAESLKLFQPEQLHAMTALTLKSYSYGFGISLIFFGFECILLGYLIFKSGFFPRTVGVLMAIAGACYLINSFALITAPRVSSMLFPTILIPAFIGEAAFCFWLLAKGVNASAWSRRAAVQVAPVPPPLIKT
ncbi:MAG TPA: DUF4386 domain-containing protein [Thermoanaerobaculia bacterium]